MRLPCIYLYKYKYLNVTKYFIKSRIHMKGRNGNIQIFRKFFCDFWGFKTFSEDKNNITKNIEDQCTLEFWNDEGTLNLKSRFKNILHSFQQALKLSSYIVFDKFHNNERVPENFTVLGFLEIIRYSFLIFGPKNVRG